MFRDDWSLDPLSLLGIGLASWIAYKSGRNRAREEIYCENNERKIAELQKQIEELKKNQDPLRIPE